MSHRVVFRRIASREIDDAADYLEEQKPFLGQEFVSEVSDAISRIADNPYLDAIEFDEIRAAPIHRFSYVVYYRIDDPLVIILGVIHGARDPAIC